MFLKFFLSFFLCISLPIYAFANFCEKGFSAGDVFISFVKKQVGSKHLETERPTWSAVIIEDAKHWTREEASQLLDFLINRVGEEGAAGWLMSPSQIPKMSVNSFIKKITAYDKIDKKITSSILINYNIPTSSVLTANNVRKVKKMFHLIESYIGKQGALYLLGHHHSAYEIFFKSNFNETKKIIDFIDEYSKKHGFVMDTLHGIVDYFRRFTSPPQIIPLLNFSELKEFGKLISEAIKEKEETGEIHETADIRNTATSSVRGIIYIVKDDIYDKAALLFSAFSKANFQKLKETVAILEEYIDPVEVANMMMMRRNKTAIYSVDPQNLNEVINILKKAHTFPQDSIKVIKERRLKEIEDEIEKGNIKPDLIQPATELIEQMTEPPLKPKEFIIYMLRQYTNELLSINPTRLKDVMTLLEENYISKSDWRAILQPWEYREIQTGLLLANPTYLQKVIDVFEKHLGTDIAFYLIIHQFTIISLIKKSNLFGQGEFNDFIKTVEILGTHIDIKDVLIERIVELVNNYVFSSEIYNTLTEISSKSDRNTMKKSLTELSLLEFIPSREEFENSIAEKPADTTTLH